MMIDYFGHPFSGVPMDLIAINSGFLYIPAEDMFSNAAGASYRVTRSSHDEEKRCLCTVRSLLIRTGSRSILIDAGVGTLINQDILAHYKYRSEGDWITLLNPHGLAPEDITDVILTHLHFDHCGGTVQLPPGSSGTGEVALTFPKATHWISRVQWEWAQNISEQEPDSFFERTFLPVQKLGKLRLVDKESEIIEGITVRFFHGHTRGLMIPVMRTGTETIVFAGDLIPTSVHLDPEIGMAYDRDPELVRKEKEQLISEAQKNEWKLMLQHDPFQESVTFF